MDQEQKEEIYREYSADNMKKLRKLIGYQTTRFGKGCGYKWVDKDYDEFLSMANMQLWKILESFNEEENDSFDDYLKTMLVRKMKQKIDSPVYEQCQKALVALMAYACQKERDSDFEEWVKKYEKTDETFSPSQKINYMFLKNNFDNYIQRGVTA